MASSLKESSIRGISDKLIVCGVDILQCYTSLTWHQIYRSTESTTAIENTEHSQNNFHFQATNPSILECAHIDTTKHLLVVASTYFKAFDNNNLLANHLLTFLLIIDTQSNLTTSSIHHYTLPRELKSHLVSTLQYNHYLHHSSWTLHSLVVRSGWNSPGPVLTY